ncbi:shikimate kinase [Campylobacter blaseri]|uniref:Shikimate kinase n=1 Tax=Campylobacter blaseri TaxID=2042961 RepID=A0A2P8R1H5_9BACT|nr:shikimate kinase [Campylobacter blaseri]PSM52341.1 shikimate kinase [Campylobacter blaseri]PSM54107.1 shikimate kinase [Campylobacter blaseri]QKF85550.1 shikimate kinase [Campylobacter blaseri]
MKKKNNIVLIGFMGVGKGATARALRDELNLFNLDCDDMIESAYNMKIKNIFKEFGEKKFRQMEQNLAKYLEKSVNNSIISTGGGFYKVKNLKNIGTIIYLKSSFEGIMDRIKQSPNANKKIEKRPLLKDIQKAKELHKKRDKEYKKVADIIIDVENKKIKNIIKEINKELKKDKS